MQASRPDTPAELSRRSFLKLGVGGGLVLAVAGIGGTLSGCGRQQQVAAAGLRYLRDADVALFRALLPVMLEGSLAGGAQREADVAGLLRRIDDAGLRLGAPAQAELRKLFDLLHLRPTRWLTTGIAAPWNEAAPAELAAWLQRWRSSGVGLFNAGYLALHKLCCIARYSSPEGWAQMGYPGPLAWAHASLNS